MSRRRTPSTGSCWAGSNSTNARAEDWYRTAGVSPAFIAAGTAAVLLFLGAGGGEAEAQCLQPDKALGVALVVNLVFLEGDVREAVEAVRRLSPDDARQPLIEFQPHPSFDRLLALVDQRLQHLALGRNPEAVVDQLGIARHQFVLEMHRTTVEAEALHAAMRRQQDRAARGLVDAARFHAD